jgi:DNA-binding SARP family transcriptional activator
MPIGDRARALIGWLALHPGPHARGDLVARLWPDVPDASARASLRTALWSIRQAWGPAADQVLDSGRTTVELRADHVDALADPPIENATGPGVGELLPGVADPWVQAKRDELRQRWLESFTRQAATAEDDGRIVDAVAWTRQRCALAPLDEAAHRDLLDRLIAAGEPPSTWSTVHRPVHRRIGHGARAGHVRHGVRR